MSEKDIARVSVNLMAFVSIIHFETFFLSFSFSRHFECECRFACEQNFKIACMFVGWFTTSDLRHSNNIFFFLSKCWERLVCSLNECSFVCTTLFESSSNIHSKIYSLQAYLRGTKVCVWSLSHLDTWSFLLQFKIN